jgi:hypothetical protein
MRLASNYAVSREVHLFLISLLAIAEGETYADCHGAERRKEQDQNATAYSSLPIFRHGFRILVAHLAALGKGGRDAASENQSG